MGTPDFAVASLQKILDSNHHVLTVVTVPDRPAGRGLRLRAPAVKRFAQEKRLAVLQPDSLIEENFIRRLKAFNADVFVVVAYRILPPEVFSIPPKGTVNLHASLLPKYRGAAPINWALINGDSESGVTTMLIDAKVDTGRILLQDKQVITKKMNAGILHDLLAEKGARLLVETLNRLEKGKIQPQVQDETQASKAPKITKKIAHIQFDQNADQVHNWIRGLSPYPAAYCYHKNKQLKLLRSEPVKLETVFAAAGTILEISSNFFCVQCKRGAVRIFQVQLQGKKRMTVSDFLNGYALEKGDRLT